MIIGDIDLLMFNTNLLNNDHSFKLVLIRLRQGICMINLSLQLLMI